MKICQNSYYCSKDNDCVEGNKCITGKSDNFSQCVADSSQYSNSWLKKCVGNYDTCDSKTKCCDPGAICNGHSFCAQPVYPLCSSPSNFKPTYSPTIYKQPSGTYVPTAKAVGTSWFGTIAIIAILEGCIIFIGAIWIIRSLVLSQPQQPQNTTELVPYQNGRLDLIEGGNDVVRYNGPILDHTNTTTTTHNTGLWRLISQPASTAVNNEEHTRLIIAPARIS